MSQSPGGRAIPARGRMLIALSAVVALVAAVPALSCSRVFWNDNGVAMVSGCTFDWEHDFKETLCIMPRGMSGGTIEEVPGNVLPMDRFVRASYVLKYLPKPENAEVALPI